MDIYFNQEAAWEPEDDDIIRGIPERYEELVEEVKSRDTVEVRGDGNGLLQNLEDGGMYGLLETREDPFEEYMLEIGEYGRSEQELLDVRFVEQEHIQDRARVVRTGEEPFRTLVEIRTRLMSDRWDARLVKLDDLDLEDYTPIH